MATLLTDANDQDAPSLHFPSRARAVSVLLSILTTSASSNTTLEQERACALSFPRTHTHTRAHSLTLSLTHQRPEKQQTRDPRMQRKFPIFAKALS